MTILHVGGNSTRNNTIIMHDTWHGTNINLWHKPVAPVLIWPRAPFGCVKSHINPPSTKSTKHWWMEKIEKIFHNLQCKKSTEQGRDKFYPPTKGKGRNLIGPNNIASGKSNPMPTTSWYNTHHKIMLHSCTRTTHHNLGEWNDLRPPSAPPC